MRAAWRKKNERNEIVYFYCTQSGILLCSIARFSRGNKTKLRKCQSQKWKKIKNSQPQKKLLVLIKKECTKKTYDLLWSMSMVKKMFIEVRFTNSGQFGAWACIYQPCPSPQFAFTGPGLRFVLPCSEFEFVFLFVVVAVVVIVVVIVVVVVVSVARAHKYKSGSRAG